MFFLCYVPFHLTAPFHTIPWGPASGDLVAHVTVIIFFDGDKDMDSRDSAGSLSSPAPTPILFGDSVSVLDRNEFSHSKVSPHCVQKRSYTHSRIVCVHQKHTHSREYTCTQKPRGVKAARSENGRQMFCFSGAAVAGLNVGWCLEIVSFFCTLFLLFFYDLDSQITFSVYISRHISQSNNGRQEG